MNWTIGNDTPVWMSPRRTIWFIYSECSTLAGPSTEYVKTSTGRLRTWKSKLACETFYNKMIKERAAA